MITETSAVAFRQNLGNMLNQVHYRSDSIVINKDGKPIAALVDARLFARIRRMQNRFDDLSQRLVQGFAAMPEEDGLAEIDAAVMLPAADRVNRARGSGHQRPAVGAGVSCQRARSGCRSLAQRVAGGGAQPLHSGRVATRLAAADAPPRLERR